MRGEDDQKRHMDLSRKLEERRRRSEAQVQT